MKKIRVAINGFGRIGRVLTRALQVRDDIELIAINDLMSVNQIGLLLRYDSIYREFDGSVQAKENCIEIDDQIVYVYGSKDPEDLPWGELDIDVVVDCTGVFRTTEKASRHIAAGAKKVLISAPATDDSTPTFVYGINHHEMSGNELVVSNASCTTNCAAPMVKIIHDAYSIKRGFLSTIHAYTGDQRLHDGPHKDMRRARCASENIVPTTTGATDALVKLFPDLHGRLIGSAIRVPIPVGSLTEMTLELETSVTVNEVNKLFKSQAEENYGSILAYTADPIVSSDIIGNPYSCIFDSELTSVNGNMVKISGWYDNESGYSNRLVDMIGEIGR
jgi:glyceraldehyde 3-phosphate dehydrogenase